MEELINITNLTITPLFNNFTMKLEQNKITVISGSNNCGKTSLLRILSTDKWDKKSTILLSKKDIVDYTNEEYDKIVQSLFPNKIFFREKRIIDQLYSENNKIDKEKIEYLLKQLNLSKNKEIEKLSIKEKIKLKLACCILKAKLLILIDDLEEYFDSKEVKELYIFFHQCIKKYHLSFIVTSMNLDNSLYGDELIIIKEGKIILQGPPIDVLSKDNIINKAGLKIPFMIDLSVKLKDYDLINKIEIESEKLVDNLWN